MATTFTEDLYDAQGRYVKTVTWTAIGGEAPAPAEPAVQVMHPPTWPFNREYARKFDAWKAAQIAAGRPWR